MMMNLMFNTFGMHYEKLLIANTSLDNYRRVPCLAQDTCTTCICLNPCDVMQGHWDTAAHATPSYYTHVVG